MRNLTKMKSLFNNSSQLFKIITPLIRTNLQQNDMSQYPKYFIRPIFDKEKQKELVETGEATNLAHVPTRAALNSQTSSYSYDPLVNLFTNYVMQDGRRVLARDLLDKTFEKIKRVQLEKYHKANEEDKPNIELNPRVIFRNAVLNCKPILQLTPIKRGGVRYQVPMPLNDKQSQFLSMKWIIAAAQDKERTIHFPEKLAYELIDAAANTGKVVKRKQDLHRQCEANRAYAHYRWS